MKKIYIDDFDFCKGCKLVGMYNDLLDINEQHRKLNGQLRLENKRGGVSKQMKELCLVFKNPETCTLTPDEIVVTELNDIQRDMKINAYQFENGEVEHTLICNDVCIILNQKGLKKKLDGSFGGEDTLEERLQYNDIVGLNIVYDNDFEEYIKVDWDSKDGDISNVNQHNIYAKGEEYYGFDDEEIMVVIIKKNLTMGDLDKYV